jgi:hypothetical protein
MRRRFLFYWIYIYHFIVLRTRCENFFRMLISRKLIFNKSGKLRLSELRSRSCIQFIRSWSRKDYFSAYTFTFSFLIDYFSATKESPVRKIFLRWINIRKILRTRYILLQFIINIVPFSSSYASSRILILSY